MTSVESSVSTGGFDCMFEGRREYVVASRLFFNVRFCSQGTCLSRGQESVTICAPAGMFVNGVNVMERIEALALEVQELRDMLLQSTTTTAAFATQTTTRDVNNQGGVDDPDTDIEDTSAIVGGAVAGAVVVLGAVIAVIVVQLKNKNRSVRGVM